MLEWLLKPGTIGTLLIFVASSLISIYGVEIRRWLKESGKRRGVRAAEYQVNEAQRRLITLSTLNDNPSRLIAYVLSQLGDGIKYGTYTAAIAIVGGVVLAKFWPEIIDRPLTVAAGLGLGVTSSFFKKVFQTLRDLLNYEQAVRSLQADVEVGKERLKASASE